MKLSLSRNELSAVVDGLKRLDGYMRECGASYTERIPFLNAKSKMEYLYKREMRRAEKLKRRKSHEE